MAAVALAHQLLPAGQGVLGEDVGQFRQRPLQVQAGWDKGDGLQADIFPGQPGDGVGEHRRGRTGVGGVVFEAAVFERVVAGGQVDGEGRLADQHRGRKRPGGRFAGIEHLDAACGQHIDRGQRQDWAAETVVEADDAAAPLHLSEIAHPERRLQLGVASSLAVEAEDGRCNHGNGTDEDVLAQRPSPARSAEGNRLAGLARVGQDLVPHTVVDPVDGRLPGCSGLRVRRLVTAGDQPGNGFEVVARTVIMRHHACAQNPFDVVVDAHVQLPVEDWSGVVFMWKDYASIAPWPVNGNIVTRSSGGRWHD